MYDEIFKTLTVEEDVLFSKPPLGLELIVSSDEDHRPKRCVVVFLTCERNKTGETFSPTNLLIKKMTLESDETLFELLLNGKKKISIIDIIIKTVTSKGNI